MRLSWNEIRARAAQFSRDWADSGYERGQTQLFYSAFFNIFGIPVQRLASFEEPVKKLGAKRGYIDLFWKGVLLVEQKSAGLNLEKAKTQALDYFPGISDDELPRYLLLSDFQTFELFDLVENEHVAFPLKDLPKQIEKFGFILGLQKRTFRDQDPVNIRASELIGKLHDELKDSGYTGHDLERFLVRIVFCLFADHTGIFDPRGIFTDLVEARTRPDGSDLGSWITHLFQVLDQPADKRPTTLDEDLARFPYVNGDLFKERLDTPAFNSSMRKRLLDACKFDWSAISPAIFGSLFQSVMNKEERRGHGAHYTSEKNILKVIGPLFLDGLRAEFGAIKKQSGTQRRKKLQQLQAALGKLTFFDPACGCGNFLIIAYRELRLLEIEILRELVDYERGEDRHFQARLDSAVLSIVDVDQFYGIEMDEFPSRIAETAMWMMDHIMNSALSLEFGSMYVRIPLKKSPRIVPENALVQNWEKVIPPAGCSYILGNPPFHGHQHRSKAQQADMARVWGTDGQFNRLDYVTCWFKKAAEYAKKNKAIKIGFVSTNSITQGEQAGIMWPTFFQMGLTIFFAHRTFQWNSEARGTAAVHCVIIGMAFNHVGPRSLFDYSHARGDAHLSVADRINGYLTEGPNFVVPSRSKPKAGILPIFKGSQPTDGARVKRPGGGYDNFSNLILDQAEYESVLRKEPGLKKWLKPFVGGDELISGVWRWCFWLKDANPAEIHDSKELHIRLERVRKNRLLSETASVREFAKYPTLFTQDRQPDNGYLAIPEVSSENREYIPIAMLPKEVIASNKLQIIPKATPLYFGMLMSAMHMAWMRTVSGRLESRYSYSPAVYNSFAWPDMDAPAKTKISALAGDILKARAAHKKSTLEVLYDPDSMPVDLRRAHQNLDEAVDKLYRKKRFQFERERVEFLFALTEKTMPMKLDL